MALKGNLRDFSFTQLLNLINLAHKTGTLVVENPAEVISVSFREGKLAYAQDGNEKDNLIAILHRFNRLSSAQQHALNERLGHMSDKELGLVLINANYLEQREILSCMQVYFTDILNQLFTWVEGLFRFETDRLPPADKITVRMDLENIILAGTHLLQEEDQLLDEIPNLDLALKFIDCAGVNIRDLNLNAQERRVISSINPGISIRQIASSNQLSENEIRRVVNSLMQAGMVEIMRPEGLRHPLPILNRPSRPVPAGITAQKSLINRLINRIRAI
ncbi:MAG: hypothetical protein A2Z16_14255 [Chloroflexi bacterium RBG_16_54_18]|nr:MAG: hypothetical protein A2Z16_14255 [Chloroflexi bacterium RBG_16_54_18]